MNEFLTIDYVLSFPGMMVICWLAVQLTKNLFDKAFNNVTTKWVVLGVAMILVAVKTLLEMETQQALVGLVVTILMWAINSLAVWLATLKAHEMFIE